MHSLYEITNSSKRIFLFAGSVTSGDIEAVVFVGPIDPITHALEFVSDIASLAILAPVRFKS